jgi:hypothetical protein
MNTVEQALLLILSGALAILLVLAIIAVVQVIKLVKVLQEIAVKAQAFVDSAENAADMVKNAVGKVSALRFFHSVFDMVLKNKKK